MSELPEVGGELRGDFEDFSDSMKAAQMYQIRLIEEEREGPDPDLSLSEKLGTELLSNLNPATRQYLRLSELLRRKLHISGYDELSTLQLLLAYEREFNIRGKGSITQVG